MEYELRMKAFTEQMLCGTSHFAYLKNNGELRIAHGTRCLKMIPEGQHPKGTGYIPEGFCNYYDLDSNGWRSFALRKLIWVEGIDEEAANILDRYKKKLDFDINKLNHIPILTSKWDKSLSNINTFSENEKSINDMNEEHNNYLEDIRALGNESSANDIVLSFSGGMDSTCLLLHYLAQGKEVTAVSFKYGQNHSVELKRADKIAKQLKKWGYPVEHRIVDLTSAFVLSASELVGGTVPSAEYDEETQKQTVVENRNIIFSSIIYGMALSIAKRNNRPVNIAQGVHSNDNSIYPDCRPESVEAARELYKMSNWGSEMVDFEAPFVNITKTEVLRGGLEAMKAMKFNKPKMKKILGLTISCYNPGPNGEPCGECGTCRDRAEAFEANNMEDPTLQK